MTDTQWRDDGCIKSILSRQDARVTRDSVRATESAGAAESPIRWILSAPFEPREVNRCRPEIGLARAPRPATVVVNYAGSQCYPLSGAPRRRNGLDTEKTGSIGLIFHNNPHLANAVEIRN